MSAAARLTALPLAVELNPADDPAVDAELHLIGSAVPAPAMAVTECAKLVKSTDFSDPHHGRIWEIVVQLAAEGVDPTAALVMARLSAAGQAGELLRRRLLDAATCPAVPEALRHYAYAVLSDSLRRTIFSFGTGLAESAMSEATADLWPAVFDGGSRIREIHTRLTKLGGEQ